MDKEKIRNILSPILLALAILANMSFFAWLCAFDDENIQSIICFVVLSFISTIAIMKIYDRFG